MSKQPWDSDRELDAARVTALLSKRFPALPAQDVRFLAEGWDSQVFEVGGSLVFRFPKRAEVERDFVHETALLPALAEHLARSEAGCRVPVFEFAGEPDALFPYLWVGYRKLEGDQASDVEAASVPVEILARQLGRALTALHAFPLERARALAVPESMPSRATEEMARRALRVLAEVAPQLPGGLEPRVHADLQVPPPMPAGSPVLVHNDLMAEHILLDHRTRELAGIIDWSDSALGDPATDFVGVEAWGGRAFTERVLAAYGGPADAGFLERVRFRTLCVAVYTTKHALATSSPRELERSLKVMKCTLAGN